MTQAQEALSKSLDHLIGEVFDESNLEKSIDIAGDSDTKADAVVNKAPKGQDDASRNAGRPKQISDVPYTDTDGKRAGVYDGDITENEGKEDDLDEADQVKEAKVQGKKGKAPKVAPFKKSVSAEEWAQFEAFQKAQAEAEEEQLQKSMLADQELLVKAAVEGATEPLRKALEEQAAIIKSMAKRPNSPKSISGLDQLEKSIDPEARAYSGEGEAFTKSQVLDAGMALAKAGKIRDEEVMELEMTGTIFNQESKAAIEAYLQG